MANTRISSLQASLPSRLLSALHEFYQFERIMFRAHIHHYTRISSVGVSDVWTPYSAQTGCLLSTNKRIYSLGESRVSSPYSAQIGWSLSTRTRIIWFGASHVWSALSTQLGFMSCGKIQFAQVILWNHFQHWQTVGRSPIHENL